MGLDFVMSAARIDLGPLLEEQFAGNAAPIRKVIRAMSEAEFGTVSHYFMEAAENLINVLMAVDYQRHRRTPMTIMEFADRYAAASARASWSVDELPPALVEMGQRLVFAQSSPVALMGVDEVVEEVLHNVRFPLRPKLRAA